MDDTLKQLIRRLVRRIPANALQSTLQKWGRLTAQQCESIDFTQPKWTLVDKLLDICEVCSGVSKEEQQYSDKTPLNEL